MRQKNPQIKVTKNGPYLVSGSVLLEKEIIVADKDNCPNHWQRGEKYPLEKEYTLCRCGHSKNKPYCDHSHLTADWDGTETASDRPYLEQAETTDGPEIKLTDVRKFCAGTSFCDCQGGTWELTKNSADPEKKKLAIEQAKNCPSGRLVAWDKKTGEAIEPEHQPGIGVEEAPWRGISGPLCVKGGVVVESVEGKTYEVRNRMTLCRCGHSKNKPFCDGQHIAIKFNDGDKSLKK